MTRIDPAPKSTPPRDGNNGAPLPRPNVRKMRWPFPIVWIIPLAAAIAAGFYFHRVWQERGPLLNITFDDASGIKTGETPVTVQGVRIGTVESVDLAPDHRHAMLHARLQRGYDFIAKSGTIFWMVRPDLSGGSLIGIGAIATGPYIQAIPGDGQPATDFAGADKPPAMVGPGIRVILHATELGKLEVDSPVYYRGIQVGEIQDVRLSDDSTQVNATAFIWKRFTPLLYTQSQFWVISGPDVKGSIFTGLHLQLGSLRSLLGGGVAFATPDKDPGAPAQDGTQYNLHDEAKKEWTAWNPRIPLKGDTTSIDANTQAAQQTKTDLQSTVKVK